MDLAWLTQAAPGRADQVCMNHYTYLVALTLGVFTLAPATARAAGGDFFSSHNFGVSYATTTSYAAISYDAPIVSKLPQDCAASQGSSALMHCEAYLGPDSSGASSSLSVYLEAPFKRQGLFYFEPGLTFSTISYKGGLASKPTNPVKSGNSSSTKSSTTATPGGSGPSASTQLQTSSSQPLTQAYMEMYGINWQGYLRFGLTPQYVPDLLVTVGLGVQTAGGRLKIFKTDTTRYVVQPDAFAELEAVLVRFSTGSASVYVGQDQTLSGQIGTRLISDYPSGTNLSNFQLSLVAGSVGIRVLFPF